MRKEKKIVQIKSRVSQEDLARIRRLVSEYGFSSSYEFVGASVRIVMLALEGVKSDCSLESEICTEFCELGDGELPDFGKKVSEEGRQQLLRLLFPSSVPSVSTRDRNGRGGGRPAPIHTSLWAQNFIRKHYDRIHDVFREKDKAGRRTRSGVPHLDIFHETIERMCVDTDTYEDYDAFEARWLYVFKRGGANFNI